MGRTHLLHVKGLAFPLRMRRGTSDADAFRQVFVEREYDCFPRSLRPRWIVDCGANVGYTSAFYLSRYRSARVVAVEPEASNAAECARNLAQFGPRAVCMRRAVWPCRTTLRVRRGAYRDGRDWSTQVEEARDAIGGDTVEAMTLPDVFDAVGAEVVDILKIDIEGAERHVFDEHAWQWLRRTRNLVIEVHDAIAQERIDRALSVFSCDSVRRSGELSVYCGIRPNR